MKMFSTNQFKEIFMANVTITFEDAEDGVHVKVESDPQFPEPNSFEGNLTEAQNMGIAMLHLLQEKMTEETEAETKDCCNDSGCKCSH
jgi:hypothetical protein